MTPPIKPEQIRKTLYGRYLMDVTLLTTLDNEHRHYTKDYALAVIERIKEHNKPFNRTFGINLALTAVLFAFCLGIPFNAKIPYTETYLSDISGLHVFLLFISANLSAIIAFSFTHHKVMEGTATKVLETIYTEHDKYRSDTFQIYAMQYLQNTTYKGIFRVYWLIKNSFWQKLSMAIIMSGAAIYTLFVIALYYVIHAYSAYLIYRGLLSSEELLKPVIWLSVLLDAGSVLFICSVFVIPFTWKFKEENYTFPKELP